MQKLEMISKVPKVEKSRKRYCKSKKCLVRQQSRRTQDNTKQQKKQQEATDRCKTQGSHGGRKKFQKVLKKDVDKKRQAVLI